ncbi:glycosyltransferase [Haloferacaceae archaeon DSL9]
MRIAFASAQTPHRLDTPATRRLLRVARLVSAVGHDVTVLCAKWWDGDRDSFERDGVRHRAVCATPAARRFAAKLPFALRAVRPDVIHVARAPASQVAAAKTAARVLRVPVVVDWWNAGADESDATAVIKRADAIVAPSETVRTAIRERGADAGLVDAIPSHVDLSLVRDAPIDERVDLVYARPLDEHANVETFLLALAELRGRDWQAAVIGDGPARDAAERTASDLRIDERVAFVGDLSTRSRVSLLKGAHVFAQTATVEPFPTNLLWALVCGCVGIAEYQVESSAHELVQGASKLDGTRGRLVTTPQEFAAEITAAGDLERRALDEGYAAYDREAIARRYADLYRAVVDGYGLF